MRTIIDTARASGCDQTQDRPTALLLSGGGARAAYQVGVLSAVAEILPRGSGNPFKIISGTSAGAINAAVLASHARNIRMGIRGLERVWPNLTAKQVYRTDPVTFLRSVLRWFIPTMTTGITPGRSALLDNTPLCRRLSLLINFSRIQDVIQTGDLRALAITASSYSTGESVTFFQGCDELEEWSRARRKGIRASISLSHLLASSAIPILFPAQEVGGSYYGDGAVLQLAPLSTPLHLGAGRILVIGVSGNMSADHQRQLVDYPSFAQILGHILNSVFVDTLESDVERLERINRTLTLIPPKHREKQNPGLRQVDILKIYPSRPVDEIAAEHVTELPRSLRFILRGSGATRTAGAAAVSYLLFEPGFCRALMDLGFQDAMARKDELRHFLFGD